MPRPAERRTKPTKAGPLSLIVGWTTAIPACDNRAPADLSCVAPGATPAVDGERLYVRLRAGDVTALSLETGSVVWTAPVKGTGSPVAGGGLVFVPGDQTIEALDAASGVRRWVAPLPGRLTAPLLWRDGWVVAGVDSGRVVTVPLPWRNGWLLADVEGRIVAMLAESAEVLWTQDLGAPIRTQPEIAGNRVYALLEDGRVIAFVLQSGATAWEARLHGRGTMILALQERVYVGSEDRYLYCLSADSGEVKWRWPTGGPVIGTAAVDRHDVYFVSLDNVLRALDRSGGSQRWKAPLPMRPSGGPYLSGRLLLVPGLSSRIPAFQSVDGSAAGSGELLAEPASPPVFLPSPDEEGGRLVVLSTQGQVQMLVPGLPELTSTPIPGLPSLMTAPAPAVEPRPPSEPGNDPAPAPRAAPA